MRLVFIRIALLALFSLLTSLLVAGATGSGFSMAASPQFSALFFIPVNLVSLWLVLRAGREDGQGLGAMLDFDIRRLGRDILLGIAWEFVLFIPFVLLISMGMLLMFGPADYASGFVTLFVPDPSQFVRMPYWLALSSAVLVALLFPATNAAAEELTYRRHAQKQLLAKGLPVWSAILLPSVAFGIQHIFLAASLQGMLVYALAFTGWGTGAAIIYQRSGRLMPLAIAHFLTNLSFGLLPLFMLLLGFG